MSSKCTICVKAIYPADKFLSFNGGKSHTSCCRCSETTCNRVLSVGNLCFDIFSEKLFCKIHYNHLSNFNVPSAVVPSVVVPSAVVPSPVTKPSNPRANEGNNNQFSALTATPATPATPVPPNRRRIHPNTRPNTSPVSVESQLPENTNYFVHRNIECDECGSSTITGVRYKCLVRPDYDLCESCERVSEKKYPMIKLSNGDFSNEEILESLRIPLVEEIYNKVEALSCQIRIANHSCDILRKEKDKEITTLKTKIKELELECRRLAEKGSLVDELEKQKIALKDKLDKFALKLKDLQDQLARQPNQGKFIIPASIADIGRLRFALLIGNQNYRNGPLRNPIADVESIAIRLKATCHFYDIVVITDADRTKMQKAVKDFSAKINHPTVLQRGRVAFFYFSGHGRTSSGKQILCPIEGSGFFTSNRFTLNDDVIPLLKPPLTGNIAENKKIESSNSAIIIVDACRSRESSDTNESYLPSLPNSVIAYACNPDRVAYDVHPNGNANSAYCTVLLNTLLTNPEISMLNVFSNISHLLTNRPTTDKKYEKLSPPQIINNLHGDFMFQYGRLQSIVQEAKDELINDMIEDLKAKGQQSASISSFSTSAWEITSFLATSAYRYASNWITRR